MQGRDGGRGSGGEGQEGRGGKGNEGWGEGRGGLERFQDYHSQRVVRDIFK